MLHFYKKVTNQEKTGLVLLIPNWLPNFVSLLGGSTHFLKSAKQLITLVREPEGFDSGLNSIPSR